MQGDEHQSGWKEMTDTKSGKKYWVNYATKQMSYTAPQSQEMVSEQARSAKSDIQSHIASGLSRLDELLERYDKIASKRSQPQGSPSGTEARSDLYAEPQKMVPQSGTLNMFDQRSSDSPSPTPGISPSANQYGVAPYGVTSLHPSPSPSNRSTLENLARQNFVRMQASKIPDAVDLLEAYIREPKAVFKVNLNGPSIHQSDPLIQQYGLSMFVDYYCPDEEVAPNGTTFDEAEAILAKFKHYLNNDLLLATDLGSTRQISASPSISKQKMRSGLVEQAVQAGIAKAARESVR